MHLCAYAHKSFSTFVLWYSSIRVHLHYGTFVLLCAYAHKVCMLLCACAHKALLRMILIISSTNVLQYACTIENENHYHQGKMITIIANTATAGPYTATAGS
jgi:hypothetical protein